MADLILRSLGISLGLTLILELVLALILGLRSKKDLCLVALVNLLTNPPLVFFINALAFFRPNLLTLWLIIPLEILVVIAEGLIYNKRLSSNINPFLISLILNATSYLGGLIIL